VHFTITTLSMKGQLRKGSTPACQAYFGVVAGALYHFLDSD
jgi:hypothetical protein